ncbi:MAG: flavodoxin family protein [Candidatus Competibacteraceae bacterium]|nr:flavodoxin family protein [Candidatus Competibacteraceae bacterium]
MKVTVFIGSGRKAHTHDAAELFLRKLGALDPALDGEIVRLSECAIETCRGCILCMNKGEELCPLHDDRDLLIAKMLESDGVVFATPNYLFQLSGLMKVFLDRLSFFAHRPRFFGKTFTSIVAQGIYGGSKIVDYLGFVGSAIGFNVVKGSCITTLEPMTEKGRAKTDAAIGELARRFHAELACARFPRPSLIKLMMFRMSRTSIKSMLDESFRDFTYFRDQGWFESDYYYPTRLSPAKSIAGRFVDAMSARSAASR